MILYYLDASAWVKRYQEPGTPWVESLFTRNQFLGSAALGFVEVTATLARKQLAERMDDATLAGFFERLEKDWDDFYQVHLDQAMLEAAVAFARTLRLRGADAIHLAAAARLSQHLLGEADQFLFVASDADLKQAAQAIGMTVLDPEEQSAPRPLGL